MIDRTRGSKMAETKANLKFTFNLVNPRSNWDSTLLRTI